MFVVLTSKNSEILRVNTENIYIIMVFKTGVNILNDDGVLIITSGRNIEINDDDLKCQFLQINHMLYNKKFINGIFWMEDHVKVEINNPIEKKQFVEQLYIDYDEYLELCDRIKNSFGILTNASHFKN